MIINKTVPKYVSSRRSMISYQITCILPRPIFGVCGNDAFWDTDVRAEEHPRLPKIGTDCTPTILQGAYFEVQVNIQDLSFSND